MISFSLNTDPVLPSELLLSWVPSFLEGAPQTTNANNLNDSQSWRACTCVYVYVYVCACLCVCVFMFMFVRQSVNWFERGCQVSSSMFKRLKNVTTGNSGVLRWLLLIGTNFYKKLDYKLLKIGWQMHLKFHTAFAGVDVGWHGGGKDGKAKYTKGFGSPWQRSKGYLTVLRSGSVPRWADWAISVDNLK